MQGYRASKICSDRGWDLERLNVHSHHGCNLKCLGCSHHSQYIHPSEGIDIDQTIQDLDCVLSKFKIGHIAVLGGEPLLNAEGTKKICTHLIESGQRVKLVTNGYKILPNSDWLIDLVKRGMILRISSHLAPVRDKGGVKNLNEINKFLDKCSSENVPMYDGLQHVLDQKFGWVDFVPEWQGNWINLFKKIGDKVYPYNSDKKSAFDVCGFNCPQLYKGRIYKCSHTAYFQEHLLISGQIEDGEWSSYVKEYGYDVYDDNEMLKFLDNVYIPENICSVCPSPNNAEMVEHIQDESIKKRKIPLKEIQ